MMTRERELLPLPEPHHQSAANFNAPDEPFYTADQMHAHAAAVSAAKDAEIERLRAEVAGLQIKADLFDLVVRKGLLSVHSELIDPRNHGTRVSWMQGHDKACDIIDHMATLEWFAQPAPGEPVALESVHLTRDIKGMCTVRVNGRVVIQDNGDIIDHMATLEWFAAPPAAPAVPLTDEQVAAGIEAWFTTEIAGKNQPFEGRMRAAYAAINGIGTTGGGNG